MPTRLCIKLPLLLSFLIFAGCSYLDDPLLDDRLLDSVIDSLYPDIEIPAQDDWVDHGLILQQGNEGEWDHLLWGGFGGTVVKKDSLFLLYYQGARSFDQDLGSVTYRAIGVATSKDGLHFSKYAQNPVLTWFPNEGPEEGAVSGGASVYNYDEVVMYYGANNMISAMLVNSDGRLATSLDGFEFEDAGIVLDHRDNALWGSGDEIFPIIGFYAADTWYVYYIPNGTGQSGKLGIAWGPEGDRLSNSAAALAQGNEIEVWGMGGYAKIGKETYALFLNNVRGSGLEVRTVHLDAPAQLSEPVHQYEFEDFQQATVLLDIKSKTWYMFYRPADSKAYYVKTAPIVRSEH